MIWLHRLWSHFHVCCRAKFAVSAEEASEMRQRTSSTKATVVVTGGSGFIGTELCHQLRSRAAGYNVVVVSRSKKAGEHCRMTWQELDEFGFPEHTKAVVHLAGQNVLDPMQRWTPKFQQLVYDSRVGTTTALVKCIERSKPNCRPKVLVQVTGVGAYPSTDTLVDQTAHDELFAGGGRRRDFLSSLVDDWEDAGKKSPADVRHVIIRSGVVLGRLGGMIANVFWQFYFGLGGPMGSGVQPMAWIHVQDLAGLIVHSIEKDDVSGVLNGVAPHLITNAQFAKAFAASLGRPALIRTPEWVWKLVFGPERAAMILQGQVVAPRRTLESGFQFRRATIQLACQEVAGRLDTSP